MRISTRGRYALRIILDIAMNDKGAPIPLRDISARQGISQKYMEQIVSDLVHAGYLHSVRGSHGGYQLIGSTEEISVGDVLAAVEGTLHLVDCDGCPRLEGCLTAPLWRSLEASARQVVYGISLQSLIDGGGTHAGDCHTATDPDAAKCPPVQRYVVLDRSPGIAIRAYGSTLEECFANAGFALFDQTAEVSGMGSSEEVEFTVSGADNEDGLHAFLSELLSIRDREGIVLKEFDVRFDGDQVHCIARGWIPDLSVNRPGREVHAIDRGFMEIDGNVPSVTVVFDV